MGGARVPGSRPRPPPAGRAARAPRRVPTSAPAPRADRPDRGPPPAPTMYAFVRFLEDNVCYALPVSCVRDFSPRSRLDFDNQKVYAVYRGPEELGAGPESPPRAPRDWGALLLHKAQILALAGERAGREGRRDLGGGRDPGRRGPGGASARFGLLLPPPRLFFWGWGVSKRPDQLKTADGPLCLPRLPDTPALSVCLHRSLSVCRPLSVSVCSPGPFTFLFSPLLCTLISLTLTFSRVLPLSAPSVSLSFSVSLPLRPLVPPRIEEARWILSDSSRCESLFTEGIDILVPSGSSLDRMRRP